VEVVELQIDVTAAARLGEPASVALTVHLPDPADIADPPVVCFAKPGGGYSRRYFTMDLPGPASGAQAEWHAARGWIFVSVDHLGAGDSSLHNGARLNHATLAAASHAAEEDVLRRLAKGSLSPTFPPLPSPLKLGIGQSMGGCMTVVQQARYRSYDGIGILGYSAVHTHPPMKPGTPPMVVPWFGRDTLLDEPLTILNPDAVAAAVMTPQTGGAAAMTWGFHYDDVDLEIAAYDLAHFNGAIFDPAIRETFQAAPWASVNLPGAVSASSLTPGIIAPEAAAVTVPVLAAFGERDVSADPRREPGAYLSASSVDLYVCPRMGHMHNFAGTREQLWVRIESWATSVRHAAQALPR
jgi:alpha-beta hydrolase superfamily lysophospholipase